MRTVDMTASAAPPIGRIHALVAMARPSQIALIALVFVAGLLLGLSRPDPATMGPMDVAVATLLLLLGLVGGLAYSLPPVAAMRRGWGEVLNMLLGALALPLLGVAVVRGGVELLDAVAFLPFAVVTLGSVMATAWPDRAADAATGKRTLQVRWPAARLRRLYAAIAVGWLAATVLVVATGAAPREASLAGLLVLPFVVLGTARYTRRDDPWPSVAAMVGSIAATAAALTLVVA